MGRKSKLQLQQEKANEKAKLEANKTPESTQENSDSGNAENDESLFVNEIEDQPKEEINLSEDQNFDDVLAQYNEKKKERKPRKSKEPEAPTFIISGKIFTMLNDKIITSIIAFADRIISKDKAVTAKELQMDMKEYEELASAAEAAMKAMNLTDNPIAVFYGALISMQLAKLMTIKAINFQHSKL